MTLCPQSHAHSLIQLTGGCSCAKHQKIKRAWSWEGTTAEAFTQCYGDSSLATCSNSAHISFLLPAPELPAHGTDFTSTFKGTRLLLLTRRGLPDGEPAAWNPLTKFLKVWRLFQELKFAFSISKSLLQPIITLKERKIGIENAPTKPLQWTLPEDKLLSWNGVRDVNVLPVLCLLTEFKTSSQLRSKQWKKCTVKSTAASHLHCLPRLQNRIIQNS